MDGLPDNYLDPVLFESHEIGVFLRDNCCAICGGHLTAKLTDLREYYATCEACDHIIITTNYCHKAQYDKLRQQRAAARFEINDMRRETGAHNPDDIIRELGF